MMFNCRRA